MRLKLFLIFTWRISNFILFFKKWILINYSHKHLQGSSYSRQQYSNDILWRIILEISFIFYESGYFLFIIQISISKMFKQNHTSSTLSNQSRTASNEIHNFSKLLKKLQMENVNIDQIRILKTQHTYLQKLRNHRQKIQQLKTKHEQSESKLSYYVEENKKNRNIIEEYKNTIQLLKEEYEQERQKRHQLEQLINQKYQTEKDKNKLKLSDMTKEVEEMKKIIKNKDIIIIQLEEENQIRFKEIKENFNMERKKLMIQVEQKLKSELNGRQQTENQLNQLRNLVTRQNKALKTQNSKYEELNNQNEKICVELTSCQLQITNLTAACNQYQEKLEEISEANDYLTNQIENLNQNQYNQNQLQELRRKMAQLAKGQIEKIQFIVNEFQ